jgi:hypothetical protein
MRDNPKKEGKEMKLSLHMKHEHLNYVLCFLLGCVITANVAYWIRTIP